MVIVYEGVVSVSANELAATKIKVNANSDALIAPNL